MFKPICILLFISLFITSTAKTQSPIATSFDPSATEGHNQRKIIRDKEDNIYIVYTDNIEEELTIKSLFFDRETEKWSDPEIVTKGNNPTLAIDSSSNIFLIYLSNDSLAQVMLQQSFDFVNWSPAIELSFSSPLIEGYSHKLPVADVDRSGILNIFYVRENPNGESLIYSRFFGNGTITSNKLCTKESIEDLACANNLIYGDDNLFYALQFNLDSIHFYRINFNASTPQTLILHCKGSQPCISYNSNYFDYHDETSARFLYIDENATLKEFTYHSFNDNWHLNQSDFSIINVSEVCINNLIPPLGYSFLYKKNETLHHAFSYGVGLEDDYILSELTGNILHPSIAYKHFNFEYVDFIWMESLINGFQIFHKREEKHKWVSTKDFDSLNSVLLYAYPNPFTDRLEIKVDGLLLLEEPTIEIYNIRSQLITTLHPTQNNTKSFNFEWLVKKGRTNLNPGVYFLLLKSNNHRIGRKVLYSN